MRVLGRLRTGLVVRLPLTLPLPLLGPIVRRVGRRRLWDGTTREGVVVEFCRTLEPEGGIVNWQGTLNGTPSINWIHIPEGDRVGPRLGQTTSRQTPDLLAKQRRPASLLVQLVLPTEAHVWAGQFVQDALPCLEAKVLTGQGIHVVMVESENLPGAQATQVPFERGVDPGRQFEHREVPKRKAKLPLGQATQAV